MSGYTPNKWVDREGTTRYFETIDADGAKIFTPDYTQVTEMGTPVNEDNMNHIEEGIAAGSFSKYDSMTTYEKDDLVTAIIDNELKVYKSLQDNNNGNTLTDTTFWEEVEFAGGGAGLQLFDLIEKDHILTYEESKGLALLGSYVYKEAVAGSRYGYPDFYNKAVAEKEAGVATETTLGSNTVTMYVNSNGHTFYDIADKNAVDAFYETYGVAWYYGVDTENERIFLPRNDYFFKNGTVDNIGLKVNPELPNITGSLINVDDGGLDGAATGAFVEESNTTSHGRGTENSQHVTYSFNASRSSSIYKNGGTVVADGVNVLVYMCVGNTETTSTITDVVDVTTTENDTIPLFTGMYFDFTPNNVSWLKAGEQANSGGIYETCYNELVKALTTSKEAATYTSSQVTENITPTIVGTVKDSESETEAYYFSSNNYLTTALEVGSEPFELQFKFTTPADVTTAQIVASTEYAEILLAIQNGKFYYYSYGEEVFTQCLPSTTYTCALGRADGSVYYKLSTDGGNAWTTKEYAYPLSDTTVTLNFGKPNGNTEKGANPFTGVIDLTSFVLTSTETQENTPTNIIFDGKVINIDDMQDGVDYSEYWKVNVNAETFTTPTAIGQESTGQLYFKVANAVQNLELLDVGGITEALADKIGRLDCPAYITETYINDTSGYIVYSNGYCEQWGQHSGSGTGLKVTLLKNFKDTNYSLQATAVNARYIVGCTAKTTSSITFTAGSGSSTAADTTFSWKTCGYLAEGEY